MGKYFKNTPSDQRNGLMRDSAIVKVSKAGITLVSYAMLYYIHQVLYRKTK